MDEEEAEIEAGRENHKEHRFQFENFEAVNLDLSMHCDWMMLMLPDFKEFADNSCMQTLLTYLAGYKVFTEEEQMKRVVNLLHRTAIRAKSEGLFYKVRAYAPHCLG